MFTIIMNIKEQEQCLKSIVNMDQLFIALGVWLGIVNMDVSFNVYLIPS